MRYEIDDVRKPIYRDIAPGHRLQVMFADSAANGNCSCGRYTWSSDTSDEAIAMIVRAHQGLEPVDPQGRPPFTESTVGFDDVDSLGSDR